MPRKTMIEAVREAMDVMMGRDDDVVVFGEDVGFFGGVFRATQGCRRSMARAAASMRRSASSALSGPRLAWRLTASAPVSRSSSPIICIRPMTRLSRRQHGYAIVRTASSRPLIVRMPTGGGIFGGQTHSQSPEALFTHVSGLKTVVPSNPSDAKALIDLRDRGPRSGDLP